MAEYYGVKVEDIFNTMKERFRPEGAQDIDMIFGYDIQDEGKWKIIISDGNMSLEKTDDLKNCNTTMITDGQTFVGINIGKIDGMEAFTARKLKVDGDFGDLSKTAKFFKKFVIPGTEAEAEQELIMLRKTISVNQKFSTGPIMGKFLKALKEKRILAIKCPKCGRLQTPPREICAICRVRNEKWVEIGPKGTMRMLEYVYYASPDPLTGETRETPYGAIGVLLEGCKDDEVFWHLLRSDQLDKVEMGSVFGSVEKKGTQLRPVWAKNRSGTIEDIKYFEIDE